MKRALVVALVVAVLLTGVPVLMVMSGSSCADCGLAIKVASACVLAVLAALVAFVFAPFRRASCVSPRRSVPKPSSTGAGGGLDGGEPGAQDCGLLRPAVRRLSGSDHHSEERVTPTIGGYTAIATAGRSRFTTRRRAALAIRWCPGRRLAVKSIPCQ